MTTRKRNCQLALLSAILCSAGTLPAQVCTPSTTVGTYVVTCDGYLSPAPNAPLTPAKILGTASGDYDGVFIGKATLNLGGTVVTQTVKGVQKTNPDCTGTITYATTLDGHPGPPLNITGVVWDGGNRISGLVVDPGAVLSCELTRTSRSFTAAKLDTKEHDNSPAKTPVVLKATLTGSR